MSDWKPGTVAKATVRGVPDVTVFCTTNSLTGGTEWALDRRIKRCEDDGYGSGFAKSREVTDVRPLVVLDPENPSLRYFLSRWCGIPPRERATAETTVGAAWYIADQIEAQTRPPRIPEPGLWGVVRAHNVGHRIDRDWVRYPEGWRDANDWLAEWDDLIDPVLVREGIDS